MVNIYNTTYMSWFVHEFPVSQFSHIWLPASPTLLTSAKMSRFLRGQTWYFLNDTGMRSERVLQGRPAVS